MKRFIIAIVVTVSSEFLLLILLNLLPKERKKVNGIIASIKEGGGAYDIVFKMQDDPKTYYINRGLQYGLNLDSLQRFFLNKKAALHYNKTWLLSSPYSISKIIADKKVVSSTDQFWYIR